MKHLHVWGLEELRAIPELPDSLLTLDVRNCPDIKKFPPLPPRLEQLLIENLPCLTEGPALPENNQQFSFLLELSLRGCSALHSTWIDNLLKLCLQVTHADLSGTNLYAFSLPRKVEDLRLNDCAQLTFLLEGRNDRLRRLETRNCPSLQNIRPLPDSIDYLDVRHCPKLKNLPPPLERLAQEPIAENCPTTAVASLPPRFPRTLFLHGSGVLFPPKSEHGGEEENVAEDTWKFFQVCQQMGKGEVQQCKILMLGNEASGKTTLSMRLSREEENPDHREYETTHGVQFFPWEEPEVLVAGRKRPVRLNIWDFGGQELYHNTHRVFINTGSIFMLLWDPAQEVVVGKRRAESSYRDTRRPLTYWLDLIHEACPDAPRIAIVCNLRHGKAKDYREQLSVLLAERPSDEDYSQSTFFLNAKTGAGDYDIENGLHDWMLEQVGSILTEEGVVVPSYWQIAQEMLSDWSRYFTLPELRGSIEARALRELTLSGFHQRLEERIQSVLTEDLGQNWKQLRDFREAKPSFLQPTLVQHLLRFLSRTGWVYWDKDLADDRIITDQQWALDALYQLLERGPLYDELLDREGRFTLRELGKWGWGKADPVYTKGDRRLFIALMQSCGACFQLFDAKASWHGEAVYVSFEHLPDHQEARLGSRLGSATHAHDYEAGELALIHKRHWQKFVTAVGKDFGERAVYAKNGLLFSYESVIYDKDMTSKKVETVALLRCDILEGGKGADAWIRARGPRAEHVLRELRSRFEDQMPMQQQIRPQKKVGEVRLLEEPVTQITVFLSHAWDPDPTNPEGYREPAEQLAQGLEGPRIKPILDSQTIQQGQQFKEWMSKNSRKASRFVLIHTDRYWTRPSCMFELREFYDSFVSRPEEMGNVLLTVAHLRSDIHLPEKQRNYQAFWDSFPGDDNIPGLDPVRFRVRAQELIEEFGNKWATGRLNTSFRWSEGPDVVISKIKALLLETGSEPSKEGPPS